MSVLDVQRTFYLRFSRGDETRISRFVFHGRDDQFGHTRASWRLVCIAHMREQGFTFIDDATEAQYCGYGTDRRYKYGV